MPRVNNKYQEPTSDCSTMTEPATFISAMSTPQAKPFVGPPVFRGAPEESISEWLLCYEHVASLNNWDQATKVKFLYLALDGDAKKWHTTQILTGAPNSWEEWATLLKTSFTSRHSVEIAYLRLENRTQLPSETPEQYYYDVVQLCARVNPSMTEDDRLRHLMRGLRPDVQEKMIIANPETCAAFLQILQRINQAALMSRASGPQPIGTQYSTSMQSWMQNITPPVGFAAAAATMPPPPTCVATCAATELRCPREAAGPERDLKAIADSIALLSDRLKSIEDEMRRPPVPWPQRTSRANDGRPRCQICRRIGHIAQQCWQRFRDGRNDQAELLDNQNKQHNPSGNDNGRA
ncbi:hypothetical protein HPB52_007400 [Rhipicephalus sanguineus]|uniref:Retrotransposon gag domain-containing protein n=1 Tax=Rhipicephalus sanguineus TaxID=34632 RepID=A0A9D4QH51_RHISA|nr:hypothetical protein HPB52_007400 [Rhipicephalus sanguineus]